MKIYFDLSKQAITEVDNENQVIFTGDTLVSKLQVISNTPTTDYYVVVSAKLSNGRTIGPFLYDEDGVSTDSTTTTWEYTMSAENGFTMSKGLMNIYVWLCPVNGNNKNHKCLGAVVVNVGEAKEFGDNYFISVDEVEETEVLANMEAQIQQLQNLINSVTTIEANPLSQASTQLAKIKIGSVTYKVSYVLANQNNPTGILSALTVDGTNYKVSVVSFEWINHSETELRELTLNGNQRHVFNKTDDKPVLYSSQSLNNDEKGQARANIGITSTLFEGIVNLGYDADTDTYSPIGTLDLTSATKVLVDPATFKVKDGANEVPLEEYAGAYPKCHKITNGNTTLAQLVSSYASGSTLDTCINYAGHLYHIFYINGTSNLDCSVQNAENVIVYKWNSVSTSITVSSICAGTGAATSHKLVLKADKTYVDDQVSAINGKIPSTASSGNKLATESEITSLDSRLDTIEAAMPNGASSNNKLATMQDIATVYKPKGSVTNYSDLPTTGLTVGDVYNIINADSTHGIKAGENVVWNGTTWDPLGGVVDLSGYQPIIDSSHKLSSDLVDDTNKTNKFVDSNKLNVLKATKYLTYEDITTTNISTFINANFTAQIDHSGSILCVYPDHNTDDRKYALIFYSAGSLYDTGTLDIIKFYANDIIKYHWTLTSGLPTMTLIQALAGTNATSSESLKNKVDKVSGKGLSTNDFSNTDVETLAGAEQTSNKVTSMSSSSTDTQYPSAKAVYDALQSAGAGVIHYNSDDNIATINAITKILGGLYLGEDELEVETAIGNIEDDIADINETLEEFSEASTDITDTTLYKISGVADSLALPKKSQVEIIKVEGNSYVYNQKVANNNLTSSTSLKGFDFSNNNGKIVINGTSNQNGELPLIQNEISITGGHKFLLKCVDNPLNETNYRFQVWANDSNISRENNYGGYSIFETQPTDYNLKIWFWWENSGITVDHLTCQIILIDLTQWFGSNDNIPSDLLDNPSLFRSKYYTGSLDYSAGEIIDADTTELESCGVNLFDGTSYQGSISGTDGTTMTSTTRCYTDYIEIEPNTEYCYTINPTYRDNNKSIYEIYYYDSNKNFISYNMNVNAVTYDTKTTPSNAKYIRVLLRFLSGGTTIPSDWTNVLCINYSNASINGNYYPYTHDSVNVGSDVLRSVNDVRDIKTADGSITRKVGVVDLGDLEWSQSTTNVYFSSYLLNKANNKNFVISNNYTIVSTYSNLVATNNSAYCGGTNNDQIYIHDNNYSTTNEIKTAMQGVLVQYELATPTTEQGTPFSSNALAVEMYGAEWQNETIPLQVTKNYDISIKDQVLTNVEVDKRQQADIDELREEVKEKHLYQIVLGDNDDAIMIPAFLVSNLGEADYQYSIDTDRDANEFTQSELKLLWEIGNVIAKLAPSNYFPPERKVGDYSFVVSYNSNNNKITWGCIYSSNTLCNIEITKSGSTYTCTDKSGTGYMYFFIEKIY